MFAVWSIRSSRGRATFTDDLLSLAGAENAVRVNGGRITPLESLLAAPPDLILYPRGAVTPQQIEVLQNASPRSLSDRSGR